VATDDKFALGTHDSIRRRSPAYFRGVFTGGHCRLPLLLD